MSSSYIADFSVKWDNSNLPLTNAYESVGKFIDWLNALLNSYFPIKTKQLGSKNIRNPWLTNNLLLCIKKKHKFYKQMKDGHLSQTFYNKYRNLTSWAIKESKKRYYNDAVTAAKNDIKGTWSILNNLLDRRIKDSVTEIEINNDGDTTTDPMQIATKLNNYFNSIPIDLHNSLPPQHEQNQFNNFPCNSNSIFLSLSYAQEVSSVINSFVSKKCNLDDIPFKILKSIAPSISDHISSLFNLMIEEGHYPQELKTARITPVLKSGNPLQCNNYRPISVLSSLNKIFERLISIRLNNLEHLKESHPSVFQVLKILG